MISWIIGDARDIQLVSFSPDKKSITYVLPVIKDILTPWTICIDTIPVGIYDKVNFCGWLKKENSYKPIYGVSRNDSSFIVLGDSEGEKYKEIGTSKELAVEISSDSTTFAYWAKDTLSEFVVVNGVRGKPYESVSRPIISKINNIIAYRACKKDKWYIIFNNMEYGPYDAVGQPVISADGSTVAFIVSSGGTWISNDYCGGKWFIVINGKEQKKYDWVWNPVFSDDGKHIAYRASKGGRWSGKTYTGEKWFIVLDNKELGDYTGTSDPFFTKKNNIISFVATKKEGWFIVIGEEEFGPFDYVDRFNTALQVGTDDIAYTASIGGKWSGNKYYGGKWFVVLNGKQGKTFDCIWITPQFDTLSGLMGYVGSNDGIWDSTGYQGGNYFVVVSDGEKEIISSPLPQIYSFKFSPYVKNSYALIIEIQREKPFQLMFFDGKKAYFSDFYDGILDIKFHPSGKSIIATVVKKKKCELISLSELGERKILSSDYITSVELDDKGKTIDALMLDKKKNLSYQINLPID